MELGVIFGVLKAGLDLWSSKESTKYIDRLTKLEKDFYDELKKPFEERSQLAMDNIMLDIDTLAKNFIQYAKKK